MIIGYYISGVESVTINSRPLKAANLSVSVGKVARLNADLLNALQEHLRIAISNKSEAWVLANDYGWSAREIAKWVGGEDLKDEDVIQAASCEVGFILEHPRDDLLFQSELKATRIYFFFYFWEEGTPYREQALAQVEAVIFWVDGPTFKVVADALKWNAHQRLEFRNQFLPNLTE